MAVKMLGGGGGGGGLALGLGWPAGVSAGTEKKETRADGADGDESLALRFTQGSDDKRLSRCETGEPLSKSTLWFDYFFFLASRARTAPLGSDPQLFRSTKHKKKKKKRKKSKKQDKTIKAMQTLRRNLRLNQI